MFFASHLCHNKGTLTRMQTFNKYFCIFFCHKKKDVICVCDLRHSLASFGRFLAKFSFSVKCVVPPVEFPSEIETVRYCRPPSRISWSVLPLWLRKSRRDTETGFLLSCSLTYFLLKPLVFICRVILWAAGVSKQQILRSCLPVFHSSILGPRFCPLRTWGITARMSQPLWLSRFLSLLISGVFWWKYQ